MSVERIGIDTNVLVYAEFSGTPFHERSRALRDRVLAGEFVGVLAAPVLAEFVAVVTDSKRVETPRSAAEAAAEAARYLVAEQFEIAEVTREALADWVDLVRLRGLRGPAVFDALIAAVLLDVGVTRLFTFDARGFDSVPGLTALEP